MISDLAAKNAQPKDRLYRLAAGASLYLLVRPSGAKSWEFRWKREGKIRAVVLGDYPDVGLKSARAERDRCKALLAQGLDPLSQKRLAAEDERRRAQEIQARTRAERAERQRRGVTFAKVALEWIERQRATWTEKHAEQVAQSLSDHVFPAIGERPIDTLRPADILHVLDPLLTEQKLETAARVKQRISAIFEYAGLKYELANDPASLIRREFSRRMKLHRRAAPKKNFPSIPPAEAPQLLRALRAYPGPGARLVWFIAYTAARTGEARGATWDEIDLAKAMWTIPAARMKARRPHRIPLSEPAVALLKQIRSVQSGNGFVFPHPTKRERTASENAVLFVLASIGYKDRMTGHGFRSLFSTVANESGKWRPDVVEAALAHTEQDDTRAAYNRTDYLEERRALMQWWADELMALEAIEGGRRTRSHPVQA